MRWNRLAEGIVISVEDIQKFFSDCEKGNRMEGKVKFYRRKLRRFYEDLPEDKTNGILSGSVFQTRYGWKSFPWAGRTKHKCC